MPMNTQLAKTFAATIADKIKQFDASGKATADAIIAHVNDAREIGLLLNEWSQGQFTLTFHNTQSAQLGLPFDKLRCFVRIASRLPEPAATLDDAKAVMQLDFQTAGLIAIPESSPPKASTITPFVIFTNRIGQLREAITKVSDDMDRDAVKAQLRPIVEFYQTL